MTGRNARRGPLGGILGRFGIPAAYDRPKKNLLGLGWNFDTDGEIRHTVDTLDKARASLVGERMGFLIPPEKSILRQSNRYSTRAIDRDFSPPVRSGRGQPRANETLSAAAQLGELLRGLVELVGIEPTTSSLRTMRSPS